MRRGELLEVIPGVVITQHSGGGKANQYFLRGFNLDHGTDFSIEVDGMPVNLRSHAHGQGYADLNFIIPEFVQSVDYTKSPFAALALDADLSFTHARYRGPAPEDRIANSISTVVTAGMVAGKGEGVFGSVRLRYFGAQPLIEDNSVQAGSSTTFNGRLGWRNRTWEFALDLLNVLDRKNDDIAYFYRSRLPGEAPEGVDNIHSHPAEPRTFRASVIRRF